MLRLIFHEADIDQRKTLEGNNNNVHIFQAVEKTISRFRKNIRHVKRGFIYSIWIKRHILVFNIHNVPYISNNKKTILPAFNLSFCILAIIGNGLTAVSSSTFVNKNIWMVVSKSVEIKRIIVHTGIFQYFNTVKLN